MLVNGSIRNEDGSFFDLILYVSHVIFKLHVRSELVKVAAMFQNGMLPLKLQSLSTRVNGVILEDVSLYSSVYYLYLVAAWQRFWARSPSTVTQVLVSVCLCLLDGWPKQSTGGDMASHGTGLLCNQHTVVYTWYNSSTNKVHTSKVVFMYNNLLRVSAAHAAVLRGGNTKEKN
jgi:hypothetical protein